MSAAKRAESPFRSWRKIRGSKLGIRAREEKPGPWKPRARATARTGRVELNFVIQCEIEGRTMAHGKRTTKRLRWRGANKEAVFFKKGRLALPESHFEKAVRLNGWKRRNLRAAGQSSAWNPMRLRGGTGGGRSRGRIARKSSLRAESWETRVFSITAKRFSRVELEESSSRKRMKARMT